MIKLGGCLCRVGVSVFFSSSSSAILKLSAVVNLAPKGCVPQLGCAVTAARVKLTVSTVFFCLNVYAYFVFSFAIELIYFLFPLLDLYFS